MAMQKEEIISTIEKEAIDFISLQFTDIFGTLKQSIIPAKRTEEVLHDGLWFDGSSIQGLMRIEESDMIQKPDPSTFHIIPWKVGDFSLASFICDITYPDDTPFEGDPRFILKRSLEKAKEKGWIYQVAPELEFFLFERDESGTPIVQTNDFGGYFDLAPFDRGEVVRHTVARAVEGILDLEMSHHEVAPGQHEINFTYKDALTMADSVQKYKYALKQVASNHDLYASFMPKPISGVNGSGMHTHQSLADLEGKNLFFDPSDAAHFNISELAESFISGILHHIREISAVLSPTVNSYKRLVVGYEAPVYISWGQRNRSALVRIPLCKKGTEEKGSRIELRCPDPSTNPYLAFAVMLEAGIAGIENDYQLSDPVSINVYHNDMNLETLPQSLGEALDYFESSELVKSTLGEEIHSIYAKAKRKDWNDYRTTVSNWEIERYFHEL
ncbi:MAG: glutamine synthetase family protein [Candidatus Kariarchaeaceae archaeon]|jgi:glutamine synthetase